MENTIPKPARLHKRWKSAEIRLMKSKLKKNLGNQTKTARELVNDMERTVSAIQVKLSKLARTHKSLRKEHIRRKLAATRAEALTVRTRTEPNKGTELMQKIVLYKDHVRIYF